MKLPALQRVKRRGKYIGSYYVVVAGERVNLWTKDAEQARRRAREAMRGKRDFGGSGEQGDVAKVIEALDGVPGSESTKDSPPAAAQEAPPAGDVTYVTSPAPPPAPEVVLEPEVIEPPAPSSEGWAADAAAAAGDAASSSGDDAGPAAAAGATFGIDPGFVDQLMESVGLYLVEGQLWLQAQIARMKGIRVAKVPEDAKVREIGAKGYQGIVKRLLPDNIPIPDYVLVPLAVAMGSLPLQLTGATKIKPTDPDAWNRAKPPAAAQPPAGEPTSAAA